MRKIALMLALVLLLTGCASRQAYVPTGDGLSDVTRPSEVPTEPEVTAPGGLNAAASANTSWLIFRMRASIPMIV